jgi:hypothetical protein
MCGGGACASTLTNCTLTGNQAYDYGGGAARSTLYNCTLSGNSAGSGGGAAGSYDLPCTLYNCTLTGNWADTGGGAYRSTLYNCTVTGNSASRWGGGAYMGTFCNSIVYSNTAPDGCSYNQLGSTFKYSCTTPLPEASEGEGNIDVEPMFMNPGAGDFRLAYGSPCIDAGTNLTDLLTTDLDGNPRPLDGNWDGSAAFDMGAYEFNPYAFERHLQVSSSGFHFTVKGEPGRSVRVDVSTDLIHWEPVATVPIPVSGQPLIDPAANTAPCLFYRAVRLP